VASSTPGDHNLFNNYSCERPALTNATYLSRGFSFENHRVAKDGLIMTKGMLTDAPPAARGTREISSAANCRVAPEDGKP
jgi:hypothetical protein